MEKIKELMIIAQDKIGLLAEISYPLAIKKINIEQIDVNVVGDKVIILLGISSNRYEEAKKILKENNYEVLPSDTLIIKLEDKPGSLAEFSKKLANENINILNIHLIYKGKGFGYFSLQVDDSEKAKKIIKEYIVEEFSEE